MAQFFRFIFEGIRQTNWTFAAVRENLQMMILHNVFLQGIRVCILLNTLSLSLEHHDQPENLTKVRTCTSMINRTNSYDIFTGQKSITQQMSEPSNEILCIAIA